MSSLGFPGGSDGKESACNAGDSGLIPGGKIPWRKVRQPTPVFLPGESHGQRSTAGYSPQGRQESDMTELLSVTHSSLEEGFPGGSAVRICLQCRSCRRRGFNPWVRKVPWRRAWQPVPVSLPGESHGQRSMEGYSSPGHKELDTTEVT